jgi:flagellar hook-associated protein 1 FlgK
MVFVSGSGSDSAMLHGSYQIKEADQLFLRDRETRIEFTSSDAYEIRDLATNTILAQRSYSFGDPIGYGNFSLMIEGEPKVGDSFVVDGNRTGLGSNENVSRLIAIQEKSLVGESQTLHEGYLSILTSAGNLSKKASVAQEALEVVYDQAIRTKDQKAGVNLDEEAANLIRFQQSYQASARLMATANQLFEALLRI